MTNGDTLKAYSLEYGTIVGATWAALLFCYAYGVREMNAFLILSCLVLCAACLFLPLILARRLNGIAFQAGTSITYLQGLLLSFSMFLYASLFNACATYCYFEFLDGGTLFNAINEMLSDAQAETMYSQMGMAEQYKEVVNSLGEMNLLGSFDKALIMFNNNITIGILASFVVALFFSWKRTPQEKI